MKFRISFSLLFFAVIMAACSGDDAVEPANEFTYNESSYQLKYAYWGVEGYLVMTSGSSTHVVGMVADLYLSAQPITGNGTNLVAKGVDFVHMKLYSYTRDDVFETNKYIVNTQVATISGGSAINFGSLRFDQDLPANIDGFVDTRIVGGVAELKVEGGTLTADFNFSTSEGKKTSGHFKGPLTKLY
jgi:hypothetical protein